MSQQGEKYRKRSPHRHFFFRCFGSHFGNLVRNIKVCDSNLIYYSVHANTLVIKSAVHCLQLCTIIMITCETLFDDFRLLTSLSTWYNFTPGLYFLLSLEAIIIYTIFTSYRSRHVVFATTPSGMLRRTLSTPQSGGMALTKWLGLIVMFSFFHIGLFPSVISN